MSKKKIIVSVIIFLIISIVLFSFADSPSLNDEQRELVKEIEKKLDSIEDTKKIADVNEVQEMIDELPETRVKSNLSKDLDQIRRSVLKDELDSLVKAANKKKESDYTKDSFSSFDEALEYGGKALDNKKSKSKDYETAIADLNSAMEGLVLVNYEALDSTISLAGRFTESYYTTETWSKLKAALSDANSMKTKASKNQSDVDGANTKLNDAIKGLATVAGYSPAQGK